MFRHIVVPLDGSSSSERSLPHCVAVANAFQARVTLLRVAESPTSSGGHGRFVDPLDWKMVRNEVETYLDQWRSRLQAQGLDVSAVAIEGPPEHRIVDFVRDHEADLVLLTSHGEGANNSWNMGSVAQKVMQMLPSSMLIVKPGGTSATQSLTSVRYRRLMVPTDCSQRAESAVPFAAELADFYKARILLAHIVCPPEMPRRRPLGEEDRELATRLVERNREEASRILAHLSARIPGDVQTRVVVGEEIPIGLHQLIADEGIDLVVLSAHGYSGRSTRPHGSVTSNLIAYGTTPLLIVQDVSKPEWVLRRTDRLVTPDPGC